jgi:hypothetical protein
MQSEIIALSRPVEQSEVHHAEKLVEQDSKRVSILAEAVVVAWRENRQIRRGASVSGDFHDLVDKACRYRDAKKIVATIVSSEC